MIVSGDHTYTPGGSSQTHDTPAHLRILMDSEETLTNTDRTKIIRDCTLIVQIPSLSCHFQRVIRSACITTLSSCSSCMSIVSLLSSSKKSLSSIDSLVNLKLSVDSHLHYPRTFSSTICLSVTWFVSFSWILFINWIITMKVDKMFVCGRSLDAFGNVLDDMQETKRTIILTCCHECRKESKWNITRLIGEKTVNEAELHCVSEPNKALSLPLSLCIVLSFHRLFTSCFRFSHSDSCLHVVRFFSGGLFLALKK